jgi:retron-type reverse transcriptase
MPSKVKKWIGYPSYFLKLDVRKYFDSISHKILFEKLSRIFKDPILLKIFQRIINSYSASENRGVPIGNLTSQYFTNFYLAYLDHCISGSAGAKYIRYMDDMIFINELPIKREIITADLTATVAG